MDLAPQTNPLPRLALVEDDECLAILLRYNLESIGFAVEWFARGDEAVWTMMARPPALVLLDWMLPGLAGIEVLRQLRSDPQTRLVPVLMLTGCASPEERRRAMACGANGFVTKPFAVAELLAKLRHLHVESGQGDGTRSGTRMTC